MSTLVAVLLDTLLFAVSFLILVRIIAACLRKMEEGGDHEIWVVVAISGALAVILTAEAIVAIVMRKVNP